MLSIVELAHKEFERIGASQESLESTCRFFLSTSEKTQKHVVIGDLQRTSFHASVNMKAYSQKLLAQPSREYLQGMHDGSITSLTTSSALMNKTEFPLSGYYPFVYLDQNGKMSTFCLIFDLENQFWYVVCCDDPFRNLISLRFKYLDKTMPLTLESINEVVLQPEISQIVYEFIQQELNHLSKSDFESQLDLRIRLRNNFDSRFKMQSINQDKILAYTHQQINQELWGTHAELMPSDLTRKARRREILTDFERTLVHPSIESPRDIYKLWEQAKIPYIQGMLAATPPIVKKDSLELPYDFRLNFIYQDQDGNYSTLAFYLDLVNKKSFLACNHDPLQAQDQQTSLTLFRPEEYSEEELKFVIKHPEIEKQMKDLLAAVPKMLNLAASFSPEDRNIELPRIIRKLQDIFKHRFSLKASKNHEQGSGFFNYQEVDEPKERLESVLTEERGLLYTILAVPVMFLIGLFMALIQQISNRFYPEPEVASPSPGGIR